MADYGLLKTPENMTPQAQELLDRYVQRNKEIDREHNREMAKLYGGAALQIGSALVPGSLGLKFGSSAIKALTPYMGKKIAENVATGTISGLASGAVEGLGRGLLERENPLKTMLSDSALSALGGGALGYMGGQLLKNLTKKGLQGNKQAQTQYWDDYIEGLSDNARLGEQSLLGKETNKFRALRDWGSDKDVGNPKNTLSQYLFAGENALNADNVALNKAKELYEQGIDNEEIRQLTGWFKGVDDKWRYEIPDGSFNENVNWSKLNDKQSYIALKNLYNNDILYSAYPDIADLPIVRSPMDWHIKGGAYRYKDSPKINGIMLNESLFKNTPYGVWKDKIDDIYKTTEGAKWRKNDEDWWNNKISNEEYEKVYDAFFETPEGKLFEKLRDNEPKFTSEFVDEINKEGKKSLLHELQHLIQENEGFALGGSAEHPRYGHLAGEVEARLAEKRYDLSEIDKKNINPLTQFDVEPEKQVVEFNDNGLYQKLMDNSVDLTNNFDKTPTIQEVKTHIKDLIDSGKVFDTLDDDWKINVQGGSKTAKHIANSSQYEKMNKGQRNRHNKYIMSLENLINNSKYTNNPKQNTKLDKKPNVDTYHYFETNVKIGDKKYKVILNAEQYKGESTIKPQTVHLYDVLEIK